MTPEQERWAEALAIERSKGDAAVGYVADQLSHLTRIGDEAGMRRFLEIGQRLLELQTRRGSHDS